MRSRRYKKKGPVRSKKVIYDGITFQSGLEKYMYIALKKAGIDAAYNEIKTRTGVMSNGTFVKDA